MDAVFLNNYLLTLIISIVFQFVIVVFVANSKGTFDGKRSTNNFFVFVLLIITIEVVFIFLLGTGVLNAWLPLKVSIV